ncbi:NfeD family protein [Moraxella nasovis]|uniref:NfeD family protein n=1 Tax=Moraxella nasovis TaxID=2904121 RepID=UPI001F60CD90|nr:NfeD family protein [Moraxella nasovis]UNU73715.1 NfeD family protein [Moraxella nasovis]
MAIQAWHWLVFGLVLCLLEIFVPTFFLLWFGLSAILVALIAWVLSPSMSVLVVLWLIVSVLLLWLIVSVLLCATWFAFFKPKMTNKTTAGLGGSSIIGDTGVIINAQGHLGVVQFAVPKLGSRQWECQSDEILMVGDGVQITQIIGNKLIVQKHLIEKTSYQNHA